MKSAALAILVVLLVGSIVLTSVRRPALPPEPVYQGKTVRLWAQDLNSASEVTRQAASDVIRNFAPDAVPPLVRLLRTPNPVLAQPVKSIGLRAPKRVRGLLFRMIDPFDAPSKRAAAAQALRIMGPTASMALPALRQALRGDKTVSWHAALALAQLGEPGTQALIEALPHTAPFESAYICHALSTQGANASNAIPALGEALRTGSPSVAEAAAGALRNIGVLAVTNLIDALGHPDMQVRLLAIRTLGNLGPPARDSLPKLIAISQTDQPAARACAVEALGKIRPGAPPVITALANALRDPASNVRVEALQALRQRPDKARAMVSEILRMLKDENAAVRAQAAALLGELGEPREVTGEGDRSKPPGRDKEFLKPAK